MRNGYGSQRRQTIVGSSLYTIHSILTGYKFSAFLTCLVLIAAELSAAETHFTVGEHTVAPLEVFQDCAECPEMIVLPMGKFTMGATLEDSALLARYFPKPKAGEPSVFTQEGPPHEVLIDQPIAMGRNEVTNEEWMACVDDGGCRHTPDPTIIVKFKDVKADDPRQPVIDVSFYDILEYVAWLNAKVGSDVYRPPTEAEWEYAARAGTSTKFAQGDTLTKEQANFTAFQWVGDRYFSDRNRLGMPISVDKLDAANGWGLRHMSGNVFEWTMSCFSKPHLGLTTSSAYLAVAENETSCRLVIKGGSYTGSKEYARPAYRGSRRENERVRSVGFRVLRETGGR